MICKKCKIEIDDTPFCPLCGAKQRPIPKKKNVKKRGNGEGSVYYTGSSWMVEIRTLINDETDKIFDRVRKSGFKTKKEALEYLNAMKHGRIVVRDDIKFKSLYEEWLPTHKRKVTKSTIDCYTSAMKHYRPIHLYSFNALRTADLQRCVDNCGHGRRTRENMKALGTLLYKYAMSQNLADKNYAEFIYIKPDENQSERKVFSSKDIEKIKKAIGAVEYADYIYCMIYTGFRPSEFLDLKVDDFYDDYIIGGAKTAAGKRRTVTLSPKIQPHIKDFVSSSVGGFIFADKKTGRKLSYKKFLTAWHEAMSAIGLIDYTPHCARHTFATLMKSVDAPALDKQRLIGHSSAEMTAHYTHTDYDDLKSITDKI